MAFHPESPLTLNQLQTPANQGARNAAMGGAFPGPMFPSQQFTIQGGLEQLNSMESEQLQRVVNRLKRQREGNIGSTASTGLGKAFQIQ